MLTLLTVLIVGACLPGCDFPLLSSEDSGDRQSRASDTSQDSRDSSGEGQELQQNSGESFATDQHPGEQGGPPPAHVIEAGLQEPRTLNPVLVSDPLSEELSRLVFSGLVNVDPETGQPGADLANHWDVSDDGTTYTFQLRDQVQWHDGQPFSAEDVVFTFQLMMSDQTRSPRYSRIVERVADVEALDSHTVQFQLVSAYAPFLTGIATFGIVPRHVLADVLPDEFVTDPFGISTAVGTGPFELERWDHGSRIVFSTNEHYHRAGPGFDGYEYQIVADSEAILDGLASGAIDWARIGPDAVTDASELDGVETLSIPSYEMVAVVLQLDDGTAETFKERAIRESLILALDRGEAVDRIWHGHARVAHGTLPPASPISREAGHQYVYDPERAIELLEGSGWVPGDDGVRMNDGTALRFELIVNGDNPMRRSLAEWLAGSWREIGVDARLQYETWGSVRDRITRNRDFDALVLGYRWDIDPDQRAMWSSDAIANSFNLGGYVDAEVDQLLADALTTMASDQRAEIYHRVQDRIMEDLPVIPIAFPDQTVAIGSRLHEEEPTAILLRNRSSVTGWDLTDRERAPDRDD